MDANMNTGCDTPVKNADGAPVLAMAFVNMQPLDGIYDVTEAFERGTLFPDLYKPFLAGGRK